VGLERGPLSLVSITEELLGRNSRGSGLKNREYGRRDPLCRPRNTLYPQKFALISTTSGSRPVGTVRSRTKATEFVVCLFVCILLRPLHTPSFFAPHKKKLQGLSPRANYTDRATAACRRSNCHLLRIKNATWSA
jgi:hypothetical protein